MKRTAVIPIVLVIALGAAVESRGQASQQNPPAGAKAAPAPGKRPPQAKTQPEFDAYNAAIANKDGPSLEKAADDFAAKYPDSELRVLLYKNVMRLYQNANNAEKTESSGRKILALDGDDPEALVMVAQVIAERTRDSDLDRDQRFDEAIKNAQKATSTVDTDLAVPPNTPQEKVDAYKAGLRSQSYSIIGTIEYKKDNFAAAESDLQKSIDAYPSDPDPVVVLRLALALDKQQKYAEALKVANRAVELTQDNTPIGTPARRERDRLQQLTGNATPAPPANQPPKN